MKNTFLLGFWKNITDSETEFLFGIYFGLNRKENKGIFQ